jgi:hypothetical protein
MVFMNIKKTLKREFYKNSDIASESYMFIQSISYKKGSK